MSNALTMLPLRHSSLRAFLVILIRFYINCFDLTECRSLPRIFLFSRRHGRIGPLQQWLSRNVIYVADRKNWFIKICDMNCSGMGCCEYEKPQESESARRSRPRKNRVYLENQKASSAGNPGKEVDAMLPQGTRRSRVRSAIPWSHGSADQRFHAKSRTRNKANGTLLRLERVYPSSMNTLLRSSLQPSVLEAEA